MDELDRLLAITRQAGDDYDIAAANLLCAKELPGAEGIDADAVLDWLDRAAKKVDLATQINYPEFLKDPGQFHNSQAVFCMAVLATVLQQQCSVRYNPARKVDSNEFRNSADSFLHGITHGEGGTCASLPVLYAAVARRLGYPVKLVHGTRHLFCRWDESERPSQLTKDRLNVEATGVGLVCRPDQHYLEWPFPPTAPDFDPRTYLRSLSRAEEVAMFLANRAFVLLDNGKYAASIEPLAWARQLAPNDMSYRAWHDFAFLLALGVPLEGPPERIQVILGADGINRSLVWWPRKTDSPELLPAASLPHFVIDQMLPPPAEDALPGTFADALLPRLAQLADPDYVKRIHQSLLTQRHLAEVLRHNAMVKARHAAMQAEVQRANAINRARQRRIFDAMGAPPMPALPPISKFPPMPGVGPVPHSGHRRGLPIPEDPFMEPDDFAGFPPEQFPEIDDVDNLTHSFTRVWSGRPIPRRLLGRSPI